MFEFLGPLISAGSNLLGGIFGRNEASRQAELNRQMQLQFAQSGIQWRVEDAKKAGVHPLFALGASTSSYSPVSSGAADALSTGISNMGQDLGRAFKAAATAEERELQKAGALLDIERKQLDNDLVRMEIGSKVARLNQPGTAASSGPGKVTDLTMGGQTIKGDPAFSDMQKVQDRWGDMVDPLGVFTIDADLRKNFGMTLPSYIWDWANRAASQSDRSIDELRRMVKRQIQDWLYDKGFKGPPANLRPPSGNY